MSRLTVLILPLIAIASQANAQAYVHTVTTTTWTDATGKVIKRTTVVKDGDDIDEISATNDDEGDLLDHAETPPASKPKDRDGPPKHAASAHTATPWRNASGTYISVLDSPPLGQEVSGQCLPAAERYGPFLVKDNLHAELVDATTSTSATRFAAMLHAHPTIHYLDMVDCPGTEDDMVNMQIGRMIRAHGIETEIPDGGSVRSGAVDLFLAGVARHAAPNAQFGVHSWEDTSGHQPKDFPANDPVNRIYIRYYQKMGMTPKASEQFYNLTNSVPASQVRYLSPSDISQFISIDNQVHSRLACHKSKSLNYARKNS